MGMWGGLLNGFSTTLKEGIDQQRRKDELDKDRDARLLEMATHSPDFDPSMMPVVIGKIHDIYSGKGGKKGKQQRDSILSSIFGTGTPQGPAQAPSGEDTPVDANGQPVTPDAYGKAPAVMQPDESPLQGPPAPNGVFLTPEEAASRRNKIELQNWNEVGKPKAEWEAEQRLKLERERVASSAYTPVSGVHDGKDYQGQVDVMNNPVQPGKFYTIHKNRAGEMRFFPSEAPKTSVYQQRQNEQVKIWQADPANARRDGETDEQYNVRALDGVRKEARAGFTAKALGQNLRNKGEALRNARVSQLIAEHNFGSGSPKNPKIAKDAKAVLDTAQRQARQRINDERYRQLNYGATSTNADTDAQSMNQDQLAAKILAENGYDIGRLREMATSIQMPDGTAKPKGGGGKSDPFAQFGGKKRG